MRTWMPAAAVLLIGVARMPADTFSSGPASGRHLTSASNVKPPFTSQPVQGFSSIAPIARRDGWFYALADNGYGTKENSDDFLLRIYRVRPRFDDSAQGRPGSVDVDPDFIQLADPDRRYPYRIVNERDAARPLTGGDFDPESLVVDGDGSFWIGDEFGPFILHFTRDGRLMSAPVEAEGLRSPDHPAAPTAPTARRSRGFEGLTTRRRGPALLALLEAAPEREGRDTTVILEFDRELGRFTSSRWTYRFDAPDHSATEIVPAEGAPGCRLTCESYFVIERDDERGAAAKFKKVFRIDVRQPGADVTKTLVADLLAIDNPQHVGGFGTLFRFPFIAPEALWQTARDTLVVVNDNNYPETGGRDPNARDDTEFIKLRIAP